MSRPFLVFAAPDIREAEIAEVEACLRSGWLGTGPRVATFERDFAAYKGVEPSRVETAWVRRREIWQAYDVQLGGLGLTLPAPVEDGTRHAFHLYTIGVSAERAGVARDEFLERMNRLGVGTGVHYLSIPEHPYYQQRFGWNPLDFPHAAAIGRSTVSLPISPKLTDADVERVVSACRSALGA